MNILANSISFLLLCTITLQIQSADYTVGPGQTLTEIDQVPWESLQAGDTVKIHWREQPYKSKWVINRQGTEQQPIVISGVPNADGKLPVIDGNGATTRKQLNYWNEPRGIIKIGGSNQPPDSIPKWIAIENLDIRSARPPYSFTGRDGNTAYSKNAASIFMEKGEHITVRNCILHDSGNGLFIAHETKDALIESCYIYDNGIEGSIYEHNTYTSAAGLIYQYNRFGPLRTGCLGNNLKDRSAGLVVRNNWIEDGNRQLDLVDDEAFRFEPRYRETFVYGNILVEHDGQGNSQIVHYGGDSGNEDGYRKGTLFFYNNTVVSYRSGTTTLFRLSTNGETADCRNNIIYTTALGRNLAMLAESGMLNLYRNWLRSGWVNSHSDFNGTVSTKGDLLTGNDPDFTNVNEQNYNLLANSPCVNAGIDLHEQAAKHPARMEYVKHQAQKERAQDEKVDLGAWEFIDSTTLDEYKLHKN